MLKRIRPSLISGSVILAAVLCAYALQTKPTNNIKGVTIVSRRYELKADGSVIELGKQFTYISANGSWRTVKTTPDGKVEQLLIADGSRGGVFIVDTAKQEAAKLALFSPRKTSHQNAEDYRKHPQFYKEEAILGFNGFTQRLLNPEGEIASELTFIVDFDVLPVKQVIYLTDGGKRIVEPISINLGEPSDSYFRLPQNVSTKDALLNQQHN